MTASVYYSAKVQDSSTAQYLIDRWGEPEFKRRAKAVRQAIVNGQDIPLEVPLIAADFHGAPIRLADLRGINLAGLIFKNVDLSYCCFANADFTGAHFIGTRVQYSSFENAKLDRVQWVAVQASPIFAERTSFRDAHIVDSFAMGSSFKKARFEDAELMNSAFVGSTFERSSLDRAHQLKGIDITQAVLTDSMNLRGVLSDAIGHPHWVNAPSESRPHTARRFLETIKEKKQKYLEALADEISNFQLAAHPIFELPVVGKVVKGRNRDFAAVRIAYATGSSHGGKNKFKERTYQTSTKIGKVDLGDIVQIEERHFVSLGDRRHRIAARKRRLTTVKRRGIGTTLIVTQVIEKSGSLDQDVSKGDPNKRAARRMRASAGKKSFR